MDITFLAITKLSRPPLALFATLSLAAGACTAAAPAAPPQSGQPGPAATLAGSVPAGSPGKDERLVLVSDASEARYRVREQLAHLSLPSEAVGSTEVTGKAKTSVRLEHFDMMRRTVGPVLSIEEMLVLELDFHAVREPGPSATLRENPAPLPAAAG